MILLHGYTQTVTDVGAVIPCLAEKFNVVVPGLFGIGDSDIPDDGWT